MGWLDALEAKDPAYRGAYQDTWFCPAGCCTQLTEHDGAWWCRTCEEPYSWAALAGTDD